jgi:PAS domain S-box-containing protein
MAGCPTSDPRFLAVAVEALAGGLDCRWAGIGRRSPDGDTLEIFVAHDRDRDAAPFDYPLRGSPCEIVYATAPGDDHHVIESDLTAKFAVPAFLKDQGARSYRGEAIRDDRGEAFAHAFVVDDKPIRDDESDRLFFQVASQQIGAVLRQQRAEDALRRGEARYQTIVDNVADGLFIVDTDGRIVETNQRACAYLGFSRAEILSMFVWDIEVGLDKADVLGILRAAPVGETLMLEGRHRRRDGSVFPVDVRAQVFLENDRRRVMVNARDVTEAKQVQQDLVSARVEAENANRAKSDFIANVSHELRTPLNAIIGFSQILNHELLGPLGNARYAEYAEDIHASGQHLLTVISDILDFSKMEAGKETLRESEIDLDTLIDEAISLTSGEAVAREIILSAPPSRVRTRITGDQVKLRRVLINLLSNAVKYTPKGGAARVSTEVDAARGVRVRVCDDGPGMTAAEVEHAFQAFQRLDPRVRDGETGTGLGLPIARKLCELHGGALTLESAPGRGTQAIATFPAARIVLTGG